MRMRMSLIVAVTLAGGTVMRGQDVHVRVSPDSKGTTASTNDFPTIQMALDHAPQPGPEGRLYLEIAPGVYRERVIVTQNRPRTTVVGMGSKPEDVVITASQNAKSAGGTFFSSTVEVYGAAFEADNVTFENTAGNTGQAVAIAVRSDRSVFKKCRFLGDQDTLFADYGRQYYVDSYIEGGVDFIFGNATAVFDDDEIHIIRPGYLTAQSRTSSEQTTGYVFRHAKVTAAEMDGKFFYLGRPWRAYSRVVFLSSWMPESLSPQGWSPWKKGETLQDAFYGERELTGPGARMQTFLKGSHELTGAEAAAFAPGQFLAGSDDWNAVAEAAKLP
ncbi:MAG: pectin esterase [Acidobacteria bacterium]|nr:pectin esterase [Acidobacteriota bacterium]